MKRREFMAAAAVAGMAPMAQTALAQADRGPGAKDLFELRAYATASADKQKALEQVLGTAFVPACNRAGIGTVGVFKPAEGPSTTLFVLLVHKSLESVVALPAKLMADTEFLKAAAAVMEAPMKDPLYQRIESTLMLAFDAVPHVEIPSKKDTRVLQLRIYESHNEAKAAKKIEMFNQGGEVDIFRRVGMPPVFFGQSLVGPKLPNLTYMLGFDDIDSQKRGWDAFIKDPAWLKLKADPQYADTVSNITNIMLRPVEGSQI